MIKPNDLSIRTFCSKIITSKIIIIHVEIRSQKQSNKTLPVRWTVVFYLTIIKSAYIIYYQLNLLKLYLILYKKQVIEVIK